MLLMIKNIRRFLIFLFTDKDILSDISGKDATVNLNIPIINSYEQRYISDSIPGNESTNTLRVSPENIGPEKENIITKIISETPIEKLPKEQQQTINNNQNGGKKDAIVLGIASNGEDVISVDTQALRRHMVIVGMTGSGKTTMLERMVLEDIDAGRGVGLIDPHGDLYDKILKQIPKSRSNDVVLFDLTDIEFPVGFNILENTHQQFPSLIASSIVGVFKKIFGYSW